MGLGLQRWLAACLIAAWAVRADAADVTPIADGSASSFTQLLQADPRGAPDYGALRLAEWPFLFGGGHRAVYDSLPGDVTPHPAVARIIVPEDGSTAFGSGTLVAVRGQHGLVVTNWHVVRDAVGLVDVVFPDGFHSHARPLRVDKDWDLAALVIWKPNVEPVKIAAQPPRPGDLLTIHGYGRGKYRIATGHCTTYYAPQPNWPHEMVELDVEARQGDSGGPIFNDRGELAGVLFGAGQGTTMGSFAPRVRVFLASVAPDIDQANAVAKLAVADRPAPNVTLAALAKGDDSNYPSAPWSPPAAANGNSSATASSSGARPANTSMPPANNSNESLSWGDLSRNRWYEPGKTVLAVIGAVVIALRLVKFVR
jgi:serine protease Do